MSAMGNVSEQDKSRIEPFQHPIHNAKLLVEIPYRIVEVFWKYGNRLWCMSRKTGRYLQTSS